MIAVKVNFLLLLYSLLSSSVGIIQSRNDVVSLIWRLANFAINSRQNYQNSQYRQYSEFYPTFPIDANINSVLPNVRNLPEALQLIAKNDDHQCISKLLCEVTSGTVTSDYRQSSFLPSFQVDMDSLLGLLSSFEGPGTSPILFLGKAALLGYNSRNEPDACTYAYPRCPKNPDVLLNYLNNYNGGFFRFFNGVQSSSQQFNQISHGYPSYQQNDGLFHRYKYINENTMNINKPYLKFPYDQQNNIDEEEYGKVTFPNEHFGNGEIDASDNYRREKSLNFPNNYGNENFDVRQPYRDYKIQPIIYPDRTGTGELIVDNTRNFFDRNA